jgi:hypothetical protein
MKNTILRSGAGKAVIKITKAMLPLDRFAAVHDELHVRVIIIEAKVPAVIVSIEMTSLGEDTILRLKSVVSGKTGIAMDNIWICVSHTFSAPHVLDGSAAGAPEPPNRKKISLLRNSLLVAAGEAASNATADLRKAVLYVGNGSCNVNISRDIPSAEGWWIGLNPDGLSDKTLVVLRFDDLAGKPIALLYHYGIQSSSMDGVTDKEGRRRISSDLTGEASRVIEAALGGTAVFLPGASGDQAPRQKVKYNAVSKNGHLIEKRLESNGFDLVTELGGELGSRILHVARNICIKANITELFLSTMTIRCPKQKSSFEDFPVPSTSFKSVPDGVLETTVSLLRIGEDVLLLGIKPEINCITGMEIRKDSPFLRTLVVQMVNGSQKYMADRESYQRMTYEAMNSSFGIGAAEHLRTQIIAALRDTGAGM